MKTLLANRINLNKKIVSLLLLSCFFFTTHWIFGQTGFVGVGNTTPKATLDISSDSSGILIPRFSTLSTLKSSVLPKLNKADHKGLMVFITDSLNMGFWYFNGDSFIKVSSLASLNLIAGENISIVGDSISARDKQLLSLNQDTLSITNGNHILVPNIWQSGLKAPDTCLVFSSQLAASKTSTNGGIPNTIQQSNSWQSFTSSIDGYLDKIEIKLEVSKNPGGGLDGAIQDGSLRIYKGEGISGALLYQQTDITAASKGWNIIEILGNPAFLDKDSTYTIYFEDSTGGTFDWVSDDGTYNGRNKSSANESHHFKIYAGDCETPFVISPSANGLTNSIRYIDTIHFSNGNNFTGSSLSDQDQDTRVEVEQSTDEDIIHFISGGKEYFRMENGILHVLNSGRSVFMGEDAGLNSKTPVASQTFIGAAAGEKNNGELNTAVGETALSRNRTGSGNTTIGQRSLADNNGSYNTAVGQDAGKASQGSYNVLLGRKAGYFTTGSHLLYIENSDTINPLIYGEFDNDILGFNAKVGVGTQSPDTTLHVVGNLKMVDGLQGGGKVLVSDSNGVASWQSIFEKGIKTDTCLVQNLNVAASRSATSGIIYSSVLTNSWQSFTSSIDGFVGEIGIQIDPNNGNGVGVLDGGFIEVYKGEGVNGDLLYSSIVQLPGIGWNTIHIQGQSLFLQKDSTYTIYLEDTVSTFRWHTDDVQYNGRSKANANHSHFFRVKAGDCVSPYFISPSHNGLNTNLNYIDTITFGNGHTFMGTSLMDSDRDTKIEVERNADDDLIRFSSGGKDYFRMNKGRLEVFNTGESVYFGTGAGKNDTMPFSRNVFIGSVAGHLNSSGDYNTALGYRALEKNKTGQHNVAIGSQSLQSTKGTGNTALGFLSGRKSNGDSNVFIGNRAGQDVVGSNLLYIENTSNLNPLIYGEFDKDILGFNAKVGVGTQSPDTTLHVVGNIKMVDGLQGSGKILVSDFNGVASWKTPRPYQTLSISGDTLSIDSGNRVVLPNQSLSIIGDTLSINNGNSIVLPNQSLTIIGDTLSINNGNSIVLPNQTLSVLGDTVSIANGNSIVLPNQSLTIIGDTVSIANGNSIVLPNQTLSVLGDTVSIANGNSIVVPSKSFIQDRDRDTKIILEKTNDDDNIRFNIAGQEKMLMHETKQRRLTIEFPRNSQSIYLGAGAGQNDSMLNSRNVFIGQSAGRDNVTGIRNVYTGYGAGANLKSGSSNTAIGYLAGTANLSGDNNVMIGRSAGSSTLGSGNIFIGAYAGSTVGGSNRLYIDNKNSSTPFIYGELDKDILAFNAKVGIGTHNPDTTLHIMGNIKMVDGSEGMGKFLVSDSLGVGSWKSPSILQDEDGDTKIQVEESLDEDKIRFDLQGAELFKMEANKFTLRYKSLGDGPKVSFVGASGTNEIRNEIPTFNSSNNQYKMNLAVKGSNVMTIRGDSNVGIGNANPNHSLDVNGDINTQGQVLQNGNPLLPVGSITMYVGTSVPPGWIRCDGNTFNATTYPVLYAVLGSDTAPDLSGRMPLGVGNSGTAGSTAHALKSTGGEEKHTLTSSEMPAHSHNTTVSYRQGQESGTGNTYTDLSGSGSSSTYTSNSRGGNAAHNNLSPYYTVYFIIKAE